MKFYTNVAQWGNNILYRGYDNGRPVLLKEQFKPTLYVKSKKKTSDWMSLYDQPLEPITFGDIRDAKEFFKQYEGVEGFEVHGMTDYNYQYITENYSGDISYNVDQMKIWFLDIEVVADGGFPSIQNATDPIVLIAIHDKSTNKTVVFGYRSYNGSQAEGEEFEYRLYKDESTMLREFLMYWQSHNPDIVSGWNSDQFDFPYIINRITRILGDDYAKKLSPFNIIKEKTIEIRGKEVQTYDIIGVTQLDYLDLYKKFGTYSAKESYALGFIAKEEIGDSKKEIEAASFKDAYENHYDEFTNYNAHDARLVHRIDNKMKLIDLAISVAFLVKCNFKDVFGPVKTWDIFIYNHLNKKNVAVPPRSKKLTGEFQGAWVKDVTPAMYGWGMSFDFASLYPTIIRQWNISPETLVKDDQVQITVDDVVNSDMTHYFSERAHMNDYTVAANGSMYRRNKKGILPELMEFLMVGRKVAKKSMLKLEQEYQDTHNEDLQPQISALNNRQMALKILANAGYGAITNIGFRYFDLRIGEAITLTGQASDRHIEQSLNKYMTKVLKKDKDYVTYGDTDSVYLNVQDLVDKVVPGKSVEEIVKFLDKVGIEIQKGPIQSSVDHIYQVCNCFDKLMDMKREAIYSKGFWTAKKRYALMVHNSEGVEYKPYKLKIMGLDIVKASTPQVVRKQLKSMLPIIFEQGEQAMRDEVAKFKCAFMNLSPEDMAFPRSANDIDKWSNPTTIYISRTPIHVRGALLYNKYVVDAEPIQNGDKIKFIYLKMPNPIKEDCISFPSQGKFPEVDSLVKFVNNGESNKSSLEQYINKEMMFEKVFISPLQGITDAIGWSIEEKTDLSDFFG